MGVLVFETEKFIEMADAIFQQITHWILKLSYSSKEK